VRAARDEPRAYIEALEHSQERHARLLLEAAVTSNGMSTYAARERTVLMGHVDLAALRRSTDAHGVPLESALCLLLDRDVSELKEYARRPLLLGESACAVLHPAGIMTFAVHLAHTPRAFHSPLYRRDLAKALMMADQQVRITMPTADGPVLVELKVYDAAEAAASALQRDGADPGTSGAFARAALAAQAATNLWILKPVGLSRGRGTCSSTAR
jgi:hypothetical protein